MAYRLCLNVRWRQLPYNTIRHFPISIKSNCLFGSLCRPVYTKDFCGNGSSDLKAPMWITDNSVVRSCQKFYGRFNRPLNRYQNYWNNSLSQRFFSRDLWWTIVQCTMFFLMYIMVASSNKIGLTFHKNCFIKLKDLTM